MPHHARLALTISERLNQVELDMTAVHDAIARLADRLDAVEQLIKDRDESHVAAISTQVERVDMLLAGLKDELTETPTDEQPLPDANPAESGEPNDHSLL
jgi:hypothetical protein